MKISNALQNSGSKKTHFGCNEEIIFVINRKQIGNVELEVSLSLSSHLSSLFSFSSLFIFISLDLFFPSVFVL